MEEAGFVNSLYFTSKKLGIEWAKKFNDFYHVKREDVFKWGADTVNLAGWGLSKVVSVNSKKKLIKFTLKDSAICEYYGVSKNPVDHIFRGMIAGAMSTTYDTDIDGVEIKCKAMGAPYCEFITKPAKDFNFKDPLVKSQLT
jgi:predicted hydrocarbon binding protein